MISISFAVAGTIVSFVVKSMGEEWVIYGGYLPLWKRLLIALSYTWGDLWIYLVLLVFGGVFLSLDLWNWLRARRG